MGFPALPSKQVPAGASAGVGDTFVLLPVVFLLCRVKLCLSHGPQETFSLTEESRTVQIQAKNVEDSKY